MEKETLQSNMPEAVASVTYSLVTPRKFNVLFTVRGTSGSELLETMRTIELALLEKGYEAQPQKNYGGFVKKEIKYVEGRTCPQCNGRLIDTDKSIKCENNKWNPVTKQAEGCKFIEWKNN